MLQTGLETPTGRGQPVGYYKRGGGFGLRTNSGPLDCKSDSLTLPPPSLFVFGVCVRNWVLLHTAEFRRYTIGSLFCLSFKHLVQMLKYNEYHLSKRCFEGNSKVRYSNIIYFQKIIRLLKYRFLLISCYLIQWNNYLIILSTGFFQVYSLTLLVQQKLCVFTKLLGTLNTF